MKIRKSVYFGILSLFFSIALVSTWVNQAIQIKQAHRNRGASILLVKELGLTDLSLFTEASYTRHLSQADWHSAFSSHPMSLDHFPTGTLVQLPPHLRQ